MSISIKACTLHKTNNKYWLANGISHISLLWFSISVHTVQWHKLEKNNHERKLCAKCLISSKKRHKSKQRSEYTLVLPSVIDIMMCDLSRTILPLLDTVNSVRQYSVNTPSINTLH